MAKPIEYTGDEYSDQITVSVVTIFQVKSIGKARFALNATATPNREEGTTLGKNETITVPAGNTVRIKPENPTETTVIDKQEFAA